MRLSRNFPVLPVLLVLCLSSTATFVQAADDVRVVGLFSDRVVLLVDGQQRLLKVGQTSPEGVKLISATSEKAGLLVTFLVDTGASAVAMNAREARRLGIDYRVVGRESGVTTASGAERGWAVTLDTVKVGDLELRNVAAMVLEGGYPVTTLLGMSYLGQLEINNDGRLMTLRKKY